MTVHNVSGQTRGHALSIIVTKHRNLSLPQYLTEDCKNAESLSQATSVLGLLERHDLAIIDVDNLEKGCKTIVARIDGDLFEKKRKEYQQVIDLLNKPTPATNSPKKP